MTEISHKVSIPGYRIIRKIGEGGMSVVYLAYQESLKREVALKVMRPIITDEENVVKRFEQEAEIIARLYHPNIVSIYEVGHIDDDVLYYSMPYLQHGDLTTYVHDNDEDLKQVMTEICDGLSYAHSQGVIHRDIKPENILFDQFGHVQIADFGIALSAGRRRFTRENRIIGSIHYISPEQAQSKDAGAQSDVYGLGAILFEMLTGEPVFNEEDDLSLMMAHVEKPVPRLPAEVSHWQPVIDRCLAKDPADRYADMEALKQAVANVNSVPKSNTSSSARWLLMSLLVLTGVATWWYWPLIIGGSPIAEERPSFVSAEPDDDAVETDLNEELLVDELLVDDPLANEPQTAAPVADSDADETAVEKVPAVLNLLSEEEVNQLLNQARKNIRIKQLTTPKSDNAVDQLLKILGNIPDHQEARNMLSEVMAAYYELLYLAVQKNDWQQAGTFAASVAEVRHRTILAEEHQMVLLEQNTQLESSLLLGAIAEKVKWAKSKADHQLASDLITLIDEVMPGHEIITELNQEIKGMYRSGQLLTDSMGLTAVVVMPNQSDQQGLVNYALAVSREEVSYLLYDRFVSDTGHEVTRCKTAVGSNMIFSQRSYLKPGFAMHDDMPVVCVTWQDANLFIEWYNRQTGLNYRLPSEREWRHLQKLSTTKKPRCGQANLAGQEFPEDNEDFLKYTCDDGYSYVSPYSAFKRNNLGLRGLHGNVSEWLAGCVELGKIKAIFNADDPCESNPSAGLSWVSGSADKAVIEQIKFDQAWSHIGFRLVRNIN
ncbi:protein kinase [Marinicella sediminis]|uniref:Protein kinase n=1 Tax=Marinicella sediminis TaxID=1792834 RepID=A0ABV7J8P5_9GAMM|nr:bifunctional serine/threonine-protein kinase/formylglycine-generating enzyme family protein [Marinicella sediminis]